jgi:hypothetical protein
MPATPASFEIIGCVTRCGGEPLGGGEPRQYGPETDSTDKRKRLCEPWLARATLKAGHTLSANINNFRSAMAPAMAVA